MDPGGCSSRNVKDIPPGFGVRWSHATRQLGDLGPLGFFGNFHSSQNGYKFASVPIAQGRSEDSRSSQWLLG